MKYGPSHEGMALPLLNELLNLSSISCSLFPKKIDSSTLLLPRLPLWALSSLYICPNWGSPKSVHFLVSDFWGNSGCYQQILYPKGQHTVSFCVISGKKLACLSTASPTSAAKFEWACVEHGSPWLSTGLPFWKQNLNPSLCQGTTKLRLCVAYFSSSTLSQHPSISSVGS